MMRPLSLALVCLFLASAAVPAADPKPEDLLGKWTLTEASAGLPKGAIFDFQKEGKLAVTAEVKGKKVTVDFTYELKKNVLNFSPPGERAEMAEVVTLDKTDLVCKDKEGTTIKLKRIKD